MLCFGGLLIKVAFSEDNFCKLSLSYMIYRISKSTVSDNVTPFVYVYVNVNVLIKNLIELGTYVTTPHSYVSLIQ